MIRELISTLTAAGLRVEFREECEDGARICAQIWAPDKEHRDYPRGIGSAGTPEKALAIAAAGGLASIYHRVRGGFISLEEHYENPIQGEGDT